MWLFGGAKTRGRAVQGGRTGERYCEDCREVKTFHERDITDTLQVFFVDVFKHSQRRMCCDGCGEDYDVEEFFASPRARPEPPPRPLRGTLPRAPSREVERGSGPDDDVERELAALKRRVAKKGDS